MIKEFLERVVVSGEIEKFLIEYENGVNFVKCKDRNNMVLTYVNLPINIIECSIGIRKPDELLKIISSKNFDDIVVNETERLLFSGKKRKLYWPKTNKSHVEDSILQKDKSAMFSIFTDNKIIVKLDKDIISDMVSVISSGIEPAIEFKIIDNQLVISMTGTDNRELQAFICESNDKFIDNQYHAKPLLNILRSIDFDCEMILEYGNYGNKQCALPCIIQGKTNSNIEVTYILIPIKKRVE